MGGRFSGTTIKDTWRKPRRRVEAREGGGLVRVWGSGGREMQTTTIEQK